ncbi:MAG: type III-B CRISPR module RAMP protein Cmr1 [Candidatus Hydrothermales bacterium]
MNKIILKCKLVTPMFMAGADSRTPELRASEFKGMMRWWWRAIKAEDNIERLKEEESKIFGGTEEGKSKLKIVINTLSISTGNDISREINNYRGLRYLFYSTFALRTRGEQILRSYFTEGTQFLITLSSNDEKSFEIGVASLWLAIFLGGFGTRARRGGGNIEILDAQRNFKNEGFDLKCQAKNKGELKDFIQNNIQTIKDICGQGNGTRKYTNLKNAKIFIFDPKNNWKDALNFLGEKYKDFRNEHRDEIFKTAAFGMPVMHSRFTVRMVPYREESKDACLSDRWASPLIFKVIKSNNLYFPVVVKLSAGGVHFVGKEVKVGNKWKLDENARVFIMRIDERLIENFLNSLPQDREELNL